MRAPNARRARAFVALLAAGLAVLVAASPSELPSPRPNVILVSIDTLRADHLGCYGYRRGTSPRIDAFSREALLFEQAIAAAPSTLASHASMFTSLVVPHHSASIARKTALSPLHVTLAEVFLEHGYATASWNGGAQLDPMWGIDQGFGEYHSFAPPEPAGGGPGDRSLQFDRFEATVESALGWLDNHAAEGPFFLFLHTYEVHHPYTPDPELRDRFGQYPTRLGDEVTVVDLRRFKDGEWSLEPGDREHIVASYDAEILSVDRSFGWLLDGLRERGLDESTLVVLTSDHGEEFGEHGVVGWHSHTLFDELLRVPLLVRLPGGERSGSRIEGQVSGIDVAPTILDVVGVAPPATFEGRSLLDLANSEPPDWPRLVLSARDSKRRSLLALRGDRWKWIRLGGLYDLRTDPGETKNLHRTSKGTRTRQRTMRRRADRWADARRPPAAPAVEPGQGLLDQLRALGYVE